MQAVLRSISLGFIVSRSNHTASHPIGVNPSFIQPSRGQAA
jgi:hypothetical protein